METLIAQFIELCKDWRNYSEQENGWQSMNYCKNKVWCYFALERDHSAVQINLLSCALHDNPRIEATASLLTTEYLTSTIKKYREELNLLKAESSKQTEKEIEEKRLKRLEALKAEISKLENEKLIAE